jgi:signal peptidase II
MLRYLWIAVVVVAFDQASKVAALQFLGLHSQVEVLPFLNFTLSFNTGAAFGFLSGASGWQNFFFAAVALVAAAIIFFWLRRLLPSERMVAIALCLILGGAIGNLLDRLFYGYVVDFIDVVFGTWHFWTFNIADSAISIGAVLLVMDTLGIGKSRTA